MIPLRCDSQRRGFAPATALFIVACVVVYFLQGRHPLLKTGLVPLDLTYAVFHPGWHTPVAFVRIAASFFMHANMLHLVSNMWYLWLFGSAVEQEMGFLRFVCLYLACGAVSMIVQAAYAPLSPIPIVGASGAIAGLMGIQLVLSPLSRILTWVPPVFFIRIPAFIFLLVWFYVQYANARASGGAPVAWWAHMGGFIAGVVWGVALRIKPPPRPARRGTGQRRQATRTRK